MIEDDAHTSGPGDQPPSAIEELLRAVPRLVDRTRSQAELALSLASYVPCLGGLVPARRTDTPPGRPERERVDVLSVLGDGVPDLSVVDTEPEPEAPVEPPVAEAESPAPAPAPAPEESELPVQDYDSLAASQVVPRLATLSPEDLRVVRRYEQANRNRQTILNRVAQLLAD